ncbi:MAG: hypothetical protein GY913_32645 [Proteobacteria bacterium]|nr:hypothetical protein [Pseudomonadota bacterium]
MVLGVALLGAALRGPLLWDDAWAPGYDGGYYVLQVTSWMQGAPLFADGSWVYPLLAAFAQICGDVVLGNKVAATTFAALVAGLGAIAGLRMTGSRAAGLTMGAVWACSPLHLGVSAEFLKNACGLVVLAALVAVLPRCEERRPRLALALGLLVLGAMVHKLTAVLGLVLVAGYALPLLADRWSARWATAAWLGLALLGMAALVVGVLRPVDLARFSGAAGMSRAALWSGILSPSESLEALAVHAAPLAVLALFWRRRAMGAALFLVALACTAPGLPFGWDVLSWRLVLMGFIPLGACAAMLVERIPLAVVPVLGVALIQAPAAAEHQSRREPDYAAWTQVLPTLKATVPAGERVVAHRGLCGFVWAAGDRVCENFQPQGELEGWWRIGFGMGEARLAPYCEAVPLLPGYTLVPEPCWQAFRDEHVDDFSLLRDERNPFEPRPAFVYGPGGDTPDGER